ncbi:MAG: 3-dehydroquinate synthase, partial [Sedimentisphaerales bacterium]|nr:3-dehydroquinate synthase [Sedimentisphaerales bacterium]
LLALKGRKYTGKKNMLKNNPNFPGSTVSVDLGPKSYPVFVGSETLALFGAFFLQHCDSRKAVVITDENVGPLYAQAVNENLNNSGVQGHTITVPAGEATKRREVVESIYDKLFDLSIERSDAIVALGGGVVGDLAGFVAATFKRGVNYVQLPTSLLAMVDSSIGGKTGINHPRGKNMIGAFYQPKMVFADIAVLKTLPRRELGCGLAETVKHAVIRDVEFFRHLENHTDQIMNLEPELMIDLVVRNCRIKAAIVSADEFESGLRGILNLGHTIGHTIETVCADRDVHHGEAVSLGMVAAARLAIGRGLLKAETIDRITALLNRLNLPTSVSEELPVDKLYEAMKQDKKVRAGKIRFVLPTSLGSCTFVDDISEDDIKNAIKELTITH